MYLQIRKKVFFATTICLLIVISSCYPTYLIDPYGINRRVQISGLNKHKIDYQKNTRVLKVFNFLSVKPNTIFLGNSRIEYLCLKIL